MLTTSRLNRKKADLSYKSRPTAALPVSDALEFLGPIVDEIDYGLVVVSPSDNVILANAAARKVLAWSKILTNTPSGLRALTYTGQQELEGAMASARLGKRELLLLRTDGTSLPCALLPLAQGGTVFSEGSILLILGRSELCSPISVRLFARRLKLTGAETAVLDSLSNGQNPAEIARAHGVDISTVRSQLQSIRAKTDEPTLRSLLRRVSQLPPVLSIIRDTSRIAKV
jgi:DNA-binding NarL/FixJ family response regulator